jgi:predicted GNAT family N-acyltransferase
MIAVQHITNEDQLEVAFEIRKTVFVEEQNVPIEEELDEYENTCRHFLAYADGQPCGTCRWRFTEKGIKLERFAVLQAFRGQKVGSALLQTVLADLAQQTDTSGKLIYLHAQLTAMPLYQKFGFQPIGDQFEECDILHYKMIREAV